MRYTTYNLAAHRRPTNRLARLLIRLTFCVIYSSARSWRQSLRHLAGFEVPPHGFKAPFACRLPYVSGFTVSVGYVDKAVPKGDFVSSLC